MPTVIVPVGLVMGPEFGAEGLPDRDPESWEIHLGDEPQELTTDEFAAWAGAFRDPPRHAGLEVDRDGLEALLREGQEGLAGPMADPSPVVSKLLARGLLVEFDPVDGKLDEAFSSLRLLPQGQGLGNTEDAPTEYRIGFAGQPMTQVSANVYQLWSYSLTVPSLWDGCAFLAGASAPPESTADPLYGQTDALAREVGVALPLLVSAGCAFLDPMTYELGRSDRW